MLDIVRWIGQVFGKLYTALDINLFPDLSVSYIEILIGFVLIVLILKLFFGMVKNSNLSFRDSVKSIFENNKKESRK